MRVQLLAEQVSVNNILWIIAFFLPGLIGVINGYLLVAGIPPTSFSRVYNCDSLMFSSAIAKVIIDDARHHVILR